MCESRCGVCCSRCERKGELGCNGCVNMDKPFWGGECGVKGCCEGKNLNHCGECSEFPCTTLSTMGVEQGFDPEPKIKQCRIWVQE